MPMFAADHGTRINDAIDIEGNAQSTLALTTTGAQTGAGLPEGLYDVWATADVYIKVHATTASDVTTGTGYLIRANNTVVVAIRQGSVLGAVLPTGTGTLSYQRVG